MLKQKSLFTPWILGSNKWFKFGFWGNNSGFGRYLFQVIVFLKPDFKCGNYFALSWVDKVATVTWSLLNLCCNFLMILSLNKQSV